MSSLCKGVALRAVALALLAFVTRDPSKGLLRLDGKPLNRATGNGQRLSLRRIALRAVALALLAFVIRYPFKGPSVQAQQPLGRATGTGQRLSPPITNHQSPITHPQSPITVCSDPNNLPFSNEKQEGFENRIAELVARDLGRPLAYYWWAQRRGFVRNTLNAGKCDLIIGVPSAFEMAATTRPYYRSGYVFVTRRDRRLDIDSLDDPRLHKLKIGVQIIGDDYANSPPAHAFANRGIVRNVVGYSVYGDYREDSPPRRIVDAVAKGEVDLSAVWGPTAGYFAKKSRVPLAVRPFTPEIDLPFLPFVFDIAMAVRRDDPQLRERLNAILAKREGEIHRILRDYGVPLWEGM